jgi:hypothetical protein
VNVDHAEIFEWSPGSQRYVCTYSGPVLMWFEGRPIKLPADFYIDTPPRLYDCRIDIRAVLDTAIIESRALLHTTELARSADETFGPIIANVFNRGFEQ